MAGDGGGISDTNTMILLTAITKKFHSLTHRDQVAREVELVFPLREWAVGLGVTALFLVFGGVYSVWIFHDVKADAAMVTVTEVPVPYNAAVAAQAIAVLTAREASLALLVGTVDPALPVPVEPVPAAVETVPVVTPDAPVSDVATTTEVTPVIPVF